MMAPPLDRRALTVHFERREADHEYAAALKHILRKVSPPDTTACAALNCRESGPCGTCAVAVDGAVSELTARDEA